ncbi:hypothetical protein F5Y16DRAFT_322572 [Xylariaceae sp. FL0255]|nr:hypothetical protein F5Y16DRAFT_322572 [Xylariaceae sp. FL0255]
MPTSYTPELSQLDNFDDTRIGRSLLRIPLDQVELLDGHRSWASVLGRRPDGFVNIPPTALQQIKACYSRQRQETPSAKAPPLSCSTPDKTADVEPFGSQLPLSSQPEPNDKDENNGHDGNERELSWTPSPEAHLRPPRHESEEPVRRFMTQIPERSPIQSTALTAIEQSRNLEFPQSSQGPEEELEVEVPTALAYNPISVNKSALPVLEATPPSAQVVPCTLAQSDNSAATSSDTKAGPPLRKTIYKPVPKLWHPPRRPAEAAHLNNAMPAAKITTSERHSDIIEDPLSTANIYSSIIPSTSNDFDQGDNPPLSSIIPPPLDSTYQTNIDPLSMVGTSVSKQNSPMYIPPSPYRSVSSPRSLIASFDASVRPIAAPKTWETPYAQYTGIYPTYDGTLQDFITACMYIQLQYRRIRTSLYDDFIRAWVEGYLPYVKKCDEGEPPIKALRAIEWYNEIDDDPIFTNRVVTRQNIDSILNFYPTELRIARDNLGVAKTDTEDGSLVIDRGTGDPTAQERGTSINAVPQAPPGKKKPSLRESLEPASGSIVAAISKPRFAASPTSPFLPVHRSFGGMEARPEQTNSLTRSLSETSYKRKASETTNPEGKRRLVSGPPLALVNQKTGSDTGSVTSNRSERFRDIGSNSATPEPTASSTRKVAKSETAEERRKRRLAKHFKKSMPRRDSIMSSAPVRNTPTSGQKD